MSTIVVFYDDAFPYPGDRPSKQQIEKLQQTFVIADADTLEQELGEADSFINLHGPYFPKAAWPAIFSFVKKGRGLVHVGGAPFKIPVYKKDGEWCEEIEQNAYHQQLDIHETHEVDVERIDHYVSNDTFPVVDQDEILLEVKPTYSFTLHVTRKKDYPNENGSGGPMDAHFYPLLKGISKNGREAAAPMVLLEHTKGQFTGGRWIFLNQEITDEFWNNGGVEALQKWGKFCLKGVTEIWVKTNYASYHPGEQPRLSIQTQALQQENSLKQNWTFQLSLVADSGVEVWSSQVSLPASDEIEYQQFSITHQVKTGYYHLTCKAIDEDGECRIFHHGFWGFDQDLLKEGSALACERDYFVKDERPFPIVGMTYMTSDVARKYLFLPNVSAWDRDMRQMKKAGINYIRTGLWTAWKSVMFVDGHAYEEVLRGIDAFILTAKRHDLEVTFNFFSFTPETWEGENPYLDPRSVNAQKRFIAGVVSRHKETTNIQWDLINEPSMFNPKKIFQGAHTSGDHFEREAFIEWLKNRHKNIRVLQEHWNMTPDELPSFESIELPKQEEINFKTTEKQDMKGNRWLDYSLFSMEMHNRWARQLTQTIKKIAPNQLVTVGQDEALGGKRPSPFFYAEAVDYTTVHSWWLMDHLVWDGIFTKDPHKPNVVQETGIMHVERPDGRSKRSEKELKSILERKYAYSFATGGAGAVQWLWNTNHYMDNINESNIGAIRSDQTEKLETDVSYDFGAFIPKIRDLFKGRKLEDVAVIYPYSNDFSNRDVAFASTAKLTRVMNYHLRVPFRGLSEYHLDTLAEHPPKLIIVPSAHNFETDAFEKLMKHIEVHGGTLLWTGPLNLDPYWRHRPRTELFGKTKPSNIVREERIEVDGVEYPVSFLTDQQLSVTFGKNRLAELEKEVLVEGSRHEQTGSKLLMKEVGKGKVLWCSLPIELNNNDEPLKGVYQKALKTADVQSGLEWIKGYELAGVYGRRVDFEGGSLFVFVSEDSFDNELTIKDKKTNKVYEFTVESDRTVMFATNRNGIVTAVYRPDEVNVTTP
ncbi:beta-galactosidase [Aquibacillus albus]|uniref:Glycoside hydrolase family 42 N-terminal domain-containing protein n=1 Tax=Aquibacillus albus TaxID=1168171 RepID=A0ABS2N4F4_9BACI|nr:beta-galactosidase [Aquibacillus albus]MBM7572999.1 hypothetical protein [Aquibacillus albus]